VEILLDDKEYQIGKNVVGIILHDARNEDVIRAQITFVFNYLVSGKISIVTPTATDKDRGLYIVSRLDFQHEVTRTLTVTVKKGRIEDRVRFVLPGALKTRL